MSRAAADQPTLTGLVGLLQAPGLHVRQMVAFLLVAAGSSITHPCAGWCRGPLRVMSTATR